MSSQPLGRVSISDFAVMGKIGEGGYGTVLLGKHKASSSVVALKMLLKDSIKSEMQAERVLGEAQALSEVSHPFIVSMRGAFQDETHIFFVLEYVGGGDVFSRLHDNGPLTLDSGRTLCAEVALALGHLHERGYMYRDLKSENVLVCIDGHVKLTDFGLAKKVVDKRVGRTTRAPDGHDRFTRRHSKFVGTPDTLAPEVMGVAKALGPGGDYGASVDWWGLGILAGEVFTGLHDVLIASGAEERGRRKLLAAYETESHLREAVLNSIPEPAAEFVRALLTVDVSRRLGCIGGGATPTPSGVPGIEQVKAHPFMVDINFEALLQKSPEMVPPMPSTITPGNSVRGGNAFGPGGAFGSAAGEHSPTCPSPLSTLPYGMGRQMSMNKIEQGLIEFLNTPATELCNAAANGDMEKLRALIQNDTDPDSYDYDQRTALHLAASEGLLEVVQFLIQEAGANHSPVDRWGGTPLDDSMRADRQEVAAYLESVGATRGLRLSRDLLEDPQAALCNAAAKGDLAMIKTLLSTGVSMDEGDYDKRTALHLAASEGLEDVVKYLIQEAGANHSPVDRWGGTPLDDAMRSEHTEVVSFLKSIEAKGGKTAGRGLEKSGSAELCEAASKGDVQRLRYLVNVLKVNVDEGDYDKRTAIHLASSEGLLDVAKCLVLDLSANHSPVDRWGNTPLDDAMRSEHGPVAVFLLAQGALRGQGYERRASREDMDASGSSKESFYSYRGDMSPATDSRAAAAELCDAAYSGDIQRLSMMLAQGVDVNRGDYDQRTALHLASSEGMLEVVKFLVEEAGANHSPRDRWGGTPLDDAVRQGQKSVRQFLESKGATVSKAAAKSSACTIS